MPKAIPFLEGAYELGVEHQSSEALIGQVHDVQRKGAATVRTPIARIYAFAHPSADMTHAHWSVRLFISTKPPGPVPSISADLAKALGELLIDKGICSKPMALHIHSASEKEHLEFGVVFHDDE